jgi:hypothetical protein
LKINGNSAVNFSFGLARNLAFTNLFFFKVENRLFAKIMVSSVYIPTTPNWSSVIDIRKHGSYVDVIINSLFL